MGSRSARPAAFDAARFIRANMRLLPAPSVPEISLYTAHPGSGLRRMTPAGEDAPPPYWAFPWAGGLALARHFLDRPETVRGRRVLDLGAGSGLVAIAAAKAGARQAIAAEVDPNGVTALGLNAAANGVAVAVVSGDMTGGPPPDVDVIAVGDLFYAAELAGRVTAFLDRCVAAGIAVLVGDPGREFLPRGKLRLLAEYGVADFGQPAGGSGRSGVFAFGPAPGA